MRRCRRVLDLLGDYLSDGLDARGQRLVRSHLAECPRCATEFRASRALLSRLPSERAETAPPEVKARLLAAVRASRRPAPSFFRPGRVGWGLASAAASVAAAAVLLWIVQPRPTPGATREVQANFLPTPVPGLFHPRPPLPSAAPAAPQAAAAPAATRLAPVASTRVNRHSGGPREDQPAKPEPPEATPAPAPESVSPEAEEALVAPTPAGPDDATLLPAAE